MEFFDWINVPLVLMEYFVVGNATSYYWILFGVAGALTLFCLIMGGFGIMEMCKRVGIQHGWLGFLPFANTYMCGKLAGESNVFGARMKRPGLWAMIVEIVFVIANIFSLVLVFQLSKYIAWVNVDGELVYQFVEEYVPISMRWMILASDIFDIFVPLLSFVQLFFFWILYLTFFRKYYVRSPFLMTFLCAFLPVRGLVLFAVRKNTPIDYNAWMQQRMQQYQAQQGGYNGGYGNQGGYNGGYGNQGGYNGGYNGNNGNYGNGQGGYGGHPTEDPFSDFGGGTSDGPSDSDNPFSDF